MPIPPQQLGRWIDAYAATLELYAEAWTNSPEDCVQEAFIELASQQIPPENPSAWLFRVVKNKALNAARGARRRQLREQAAGFSRDWNDLGEASGMFADAEHVARALNQLDAEHREVTILRIWGGLGFEEIAQTIGCAVSTAHRRYGTALRQLREILETPSCREPATPGPRTPQTE